MASVQEMTDAELIALLESIEPETAPELEQAVLDEIERRNLDI